MTTLPLPDASDHSTTAHRLERRLVWLIATAFTLAPFCLFYRQYPLVPVAAITLATAIGWRRQLPTASALGMMAGVSLLVFWAGVGMPIAAFLLALSLFWLLARRTPWLRDSANWLPKGGLDGSTLAWCGATAALAGAALVVWQQWTHPDLSDLYRQIPLKQMPATLLVLGGIAFAALNAAAEEIMYRGVLLHALSHTLGVRLALPLQAVAFGILHINGFPRGVVGMGLAAIYGLMMGAIRLRAKGMLAPWLAHLVTDMTIVGILVATMP